MTTKKIDQMEARTGRMRKEDDSVVNIAEGFDPTTKTFGMQLIGSKAQDYESITVDGTEGGVALTAAKYGTCTKAFITAETASIRFTVDGTTPTATVGHLVNPGTTVVKLDSNEDIAAFRAIRTGAISATIHVTYSV